jgi:hypothetical protein
MLPPTHGALLPHIARANFVSMRDKSYTIALPSLPPIEQNGLFCEEGVYYPLRSLLPPPAPVAVLELSRCSCKTSCKGNRCTCYKNSLPCTPLCKCTEIDSTNTVRLHYTMCLMMMLMILLWRC